MMGKGFYFKKFSKKIIKFSLGFFLGFMAVQWLILSWGCGGEGAPCSKDEDCGTGFYCNSFNSKCTRGCRLSVECAQGEICRNNTCLPPLRDEDKDGFATPYDCDDGDYLVHPEALEICGNKKDDDCDGETDEKDCSVRECRPGESKECYSGKEKFLQKDSPCKKGRQVCSGSGRWGPCLGEVLPSEELCDGKDNDCDGSIDEDKDGNPLSRECYTGPKEARGRGVCRPGRELCIGGTWGKCRGEILPEVESCNGKDDDCDGQVDNPPDLGEKCQTSLKGECRAGRLECDLKERKLLCKPLNKPERERCGDGVDNDCDGEIDEECPYTAKKFAQLQSEVTALAVGSENGVAAVKSPPQLLLYSFKGKPLPKFESKLSAAEEICAIRFYGGNYFLLSNKKLYQLDYSKKKVSLLLPLPPGDNCPALEEMGGKLYWRNASSDTSGKYELSLCVYDLSTKKSFCKVLSEKVAWMGDSVAVWGASMVMPSSLGLLFFDVVDLTEDPKKRIPLGGGRYSEIAVEKAGDTAILVSPTDKKVQVINLLSRKSSGGLELRSVGGLTVKPARAVIYKKFAFISIRDSREVYAFDLEKLSVGRRISVGPAPYNLALSEIAPSLGARVIWTFCRGDRSLWSFSLER